MEEEAKRGRLTDEERVAVKSAFRGNRALISALRKLFAPQYDYEAPIGKQMDIRWMGLEQMMSMSPQDRELVFLSQIRLNNHLEQQLAVLTVIANEKEETPAEKEARVKKDSLK